MSAWEHDPELGFGSPTPAPAPVAEKRQRSEPLIAMPGVMAARSLEKLAKGRTGKKPAFVDLPCFTC